MIDNHGEWAKIEGRQWLGTNILKSCTKTSFSKRLVINLISFFMSIRVIHRDSRWKYLNVLYNILINSFRSRFQFIRQSNKKPNDRHQQPPNTQQTSKFPLMDSE